MIFCATAVPTYQYVLVFISIGNGCAVQVWFVVGDRTSWFWGSLTQTPWMAMMISVNLKMRCSKPVNDQIPNFQFPQNRNHRSINIDNIDSAMVRSVVAHNRTLTTFCSNNSMTGQVAILEAIEDFESLCGILKVHKVSDVFRSCWIIQYSQLNDIQAISFKCPRADPYRRSRCWGPDGRWWGHFPVRITVQAQWHWTYTYIVCHSDQHSLTPSRDWRSSPRLPLLQVTFVKER